MTHTPETRLSLLARLKDQADQAAWTEFVEIYRPVIHRLALHKGLQHADAEDLSQQVLMAIARAIERWEPDPQRARFRTWLHRIAHNLILNAVSRGRLDRGSGDTDIQKLLERAVEDGPESLLLETERRREMFRWAARQIRDEFQPETWDAFWLTAVDNQDIDQVAGRLGKNRGAVYAARSRIMRRLKEKVQQFQADIDNGPCT